MSEPVPRIQPDRSFFLLLTPLVAVSLPSLLFCALAVVLWMHGVPPNSPALFHLPSQGVWNEIVALQVSAYQWIVRWNSTATLAATALFVTTLLLPRWRNWTTLALIPYGLLLCADFTLRWR